MVSDPDCLEIVVVHYGDPSETLRCLASIRRDPSRTHRQIVVVDNASWTTGSELADSSDHYDLFVAAGDNPGFGAGANRGVAALQAEERESARREAAGYVVLNHDVELLPGFLDAAAEALAHQGVGAAGGPILLDRPDGPIWYAGGRFRPLTGTVFQSRSPEEAHRARDVGFIPGTAIAVRREAWEEVGGFDPGFFLYHEDLDLCLRLRRARWRLRFEPRMRAVHHLGGATGSGERSALYLEEMAATRLRPHRSRLYRFYLAVLHTPYVLATALGLFLRDRRRGAGRARALLAGHWRALKDLFG